MIKQPKVLILGAGASRAYGFPLGAKLKAMIWNEVNSLLGSFANNNSVTKQVLVEQLCSCGSNSLMGDIKGFNNALLLSPDYSIDSFLEHHNAAYRIIGKVGIVSALLPLEKRNYLYDDWMKIHLDARLYSGIIASDGHWYQYLFNRMCEGCDFDTFAANNKLSIITFNYDRSLEYYLLRSLHAKYGKQMNDCAEVLKQIQIIHVYGSLGEFKELTLQSDRIVPYDITQATFDERCVFFKNAVRSIRIIPEDRDSADNSKHLVCVPALLKGASKIYFLGFGFLDSNMEKIFTEGKNKYNFLKQVGNHCLGTAMGLSPHHKKKLASYGLTSMKHDLNCQHIRGHIFNFPDCSIYEFLHHNPYSVLD